MTLIVDPEKHDLVPVPTGKGGKKDRKKQRTEGEKIKIL